MISHKKFNAWIVDSRGYVLPEYGIEYNPQNSSQIICWIPSRPGDTFVVHWEDVNNEGICTASYIVLDGYKCPGRFLYGTGVAFRSGVRSGPATERPFTFAAVDDDAHTQPAIQVPTEELGVIRLKIKRVIHTGTGTAANPIVEIPQSTLGNRQAGEVGVRFGPDQTTYLQYNQTWNVTPYESDLPLGSPPRTHVEFIFKYRTPETLLRMGLTTPQMGVGLMHNQSMPFAVQQPDDDSLKRQVVSTQASNVLVEDQPQPPKKKQRLSSSSTARHPSSTQSSSSSSASSPAAIAGPSRPSTSRTTSGATPRVLSYPGQSTIVFEDLFTATCFPELDSDGSSGISGYGNYSSTSAESSQDY